MADEQINKAVNGAISNSEIEDMKVLEEEIELIKDSLKNNRKTNSLIYKVYKMYKEEQKGNEKRIK